MRLKIAAFLLFLLEICTSYEEKDFHCPDADIDDPPISSASVCDGITDCASFLDTDRDEETGDESTKICAPPTFLDQAINLEALNVTSTSVHLSWSKTARNAPGHSLRLAGYFVSGKSAPHSFQNSISGRLLSYQVQWMKPWTNYTVLVRPFYTESGKPQPMYKLGRAAKVVFQTLSSVLSAQQRNVVLNVVGPSAWNCDPVGFHVRWEALNERHGQQGELDVALGSEWSVEENMVNVTLPLKGGVDYRVFVSAVGADGSSARRQGPEADVEVSVALDSYEVSAYAVGSFRCLVSWRSSQIVDDFRVIIYKDDGFGNLSFHTMRQIKRNGKVTKKYNILISGLSPWTYYVVGLKGCSAGYCSDPVNATFSTPPEVLPAPSFTEVKATGSSSFEVIWTFAQRDPRLFDGFRVRYCGNAFDSCFLVYTNQTILTVDGLSPETFVNVYVAAEYKDKEGKLQRGPEATASVTTWSDVPVVHLESEGNVEDGARTFLLSWRCVNSSVDYFQYMPGEYGSWTTCDDCSKCDIVKEEDEMSSSGYLKLTLDEQVVTGNILVRGCNSYGCGQANNVSVDLHKTGPIVLSGVRFTSKGTEVVLRWRRPQKNGYNGVDVTWKCNNNDTITYNKWFRREAHRSEPNSWRPFDQDKYSTEACITGLPTSADQCDFYVSAYNDQGESRYYSLPVKADQDLSLQQRDVRLY